MTQATLPSPDTTAVHRLRLRATYASLATALVLIAVKFAAWTGTGSVALLSSLVNSMVDGAASLVTFVAVRQAIIPPDREHRFGHGKAEPLAALGQAAFLLGSALFLIAEAVRRLVSPEPIENTGIGIAVMLFSLVVTIGLVAYQRHVVRRTGSLAISADALHYSGDILMNFGVIGALVIQSTFAVPVIDPLFGGAVGAIYRIWRREDREAGADAADGPRAAGRGARPRPRNRREPPRGDGRARHPHSRRRSHRVHPAAYRDGRRDEPAARA